jgi:hypothetical protein
VLQLSSDQLSLTHLLQGMKIRDQHSNIYGLIIRCITMEILICGFVHACSMAIPSNKKVVHSYEGVSIFI